MSKKKLSGKVVSDKSDATVVISVPRTFKHPKYKKIIRRQQRFKADNQLGACPGDLVTVEETRPISKEKRWRVIEIVKQKA